MKKSWIYFLFFLSGSIFLQSCLTIRVTNLKTTQASLEPLNMKNVVIFTDLTNIPKPFEKVATVRATGNGLSQKKYWEKLRTKVAALGCNGLYKYGQISEPSIQYFPGVGILPTTTESTEYVIVRYAAK